MPPHIQDMNHIEWGLHPTITGVLTRVFENRASGNHADVLLAHVEVGGEIPWHVHAEARETAYVLVGQGVLKFAQTETRESPVETPLHVGVALTIPSGWWHTLVNTADVPLELFAFHMPPTF